jgi:hypothetical protein
MRLTSAQFELLLDRKREDDRREFYRAGIVASAIYNTSMCRGEDYKPVNAWDFVPGGNPNAEEEKMDLTKMTPQQQAAHLKSIFSKKIFNRR